MPNTWPQNRRVLGTRVQRLDGPEKATGRARYSFDVNRPGMLHARILRCPLPHAKVKTLDTSAAEKVPGFKALHVIAKVGTELFYAGDEVVGVACDTEEHAADAVRAIKVEFDPLPALVAEEDALKNDLKTVPPVGPQKNTNNVRTAREDKSNDFDAAMGKAEVVHEGEYGIATINHQCLEPHGLVAEWGKDAMGKPTLTLWASTQAVAAIAQQVAGKFQIPVASIKCVTHYMGGGYGSKFNPGVEGETAIELARKAGAPVKLFLDRAEEVVTGGNRPSAYAKVKIGATKEGKIVAYQSDSYGTPGVGNSATIGPVPYVYPVPSNWNKHTMVRLNTAMLRAMRAPGHPQSCVLTDCPLDDLAAKLGMDPMKVRLMNLPQNDPNAVTRSPQSFPALRNTIYTEEIKIAARLSDWEKRWHPPGKGPGTGPVKHGIGMGLHTWGGQASRPNDVAVTVSSDGSVLVESSTQDLGTGERTVLAIVVAEVLGLQPHDVTIRIGESQYGRSGGSGGSTTCPGTAPVCYDAAITARNELLDKIAMRLKANKDDLSIEPGSVVQKGEGGKKYAWKEACAKLGMETAVGKATTTNESLAALTNVNVGGVQIAEVLVDTETGVVRCTKVVAVQDCGLVVNKQGCESQMAGGVIMGVNYALFEERVMDRKTGRQVNPDMEFYKLGGIKDMPQIVIHMHDMPQRGVIGIGEPATISTAAAVGNAVFNAIGVRVPHAPYTPERVLEALSKKA
ncbi:MAG TPA: xanthine dehydrogenase family protein molybdopterin-binding subunit [Gemmataceae bacterium]|nr:xanthine dehydrogenase family protein molybdopterin-binding subunit [Gemmataceae bacterium]